MSSKRFRVPHTLVLLFGMIVAAQLLTYALTPGEFQRKTVNKEGGRDVVEFPRAGAYRTGDGARLEVAAAGTYEWRGETEGGELRLAAGELTREEGGETVTVFASGSYAHAPGLATKIVVAPGTYAAVEDAERLHPLSFLLLVPEGFAKGAQIIIFIFIVGGAFGVLRATGATDALIGWVLGALRETPGQLIALGMLLFAAGSSTIGMAEEYLPFVPVLIAMCLALRYDAITAIGILCVGYGIGYGAATINPFTVLIAQNIAGLDPTSGWPFRLVLTLPLLAIGFHHVYRYAERVKADPSRSLVADIAPDPALTAQEYPSFTTRHLLILGMLTAGISYFVYGINAYDWYLNEMGALFLGLTVLMAVVGRLSPDEVAKRFCAGANELSTTAILIGFAYTIEVVLSKGQVIDTVIYGLARSLEGLGPSLAAVGMFLVQSLFNLFVPSGSGQAYVTMPLMAPLSDLVGVNRQVAVMAYQFGDGFTNILVPTNAVLVGILTMARIPYERWLRFILPFMVKVWIAGSLALALAVWLGVE